MTYTIKRRGELLDIPESTVRYWRDRYSEFIPYSGTGRKRRYPEEALEVLRLICGYSERSVNADDIKEALSTKFTRFMEVDQEPQRRTTATQQENSLLPAKADLLPVVHGMINEALGQTLELMADQKGRLDRLEADNRELQAKVEAMAKSKKKRKRPQTTKQMINQLQTLRKRLGVLDKRLSQK